MEARLTILGSNSALPAQGRHPSAQVLQFQNELFLIDCGEGSQLQMSNFGIKRAKISAVFISHLHGDHIYGLPGLITSYNHYARKTPLTIYGPIGIKAFIEHSVFIGGNPLKFNLSIIEFDADQAQNLVDTDWLHVATQPLEHRIPTSGFLFTMKNPRLKIRRGVFEEHNVPVDQRSAIQQGDDYVMANGDRIANSVFTELPGPPLTYAYLSDTKYIPALAEKVKGYNTVYHEATFLKNLADKAEATKHSTAEEAAMIARDAGAKQLIIGHYSSRYENLQPFLDEAKPIFENTLLAIEGQEYIID